MTVGSEGQVFNPAAANLPVGGGPVIPPTQGRQGEYLLSQLHGKFFAAALNKNLYSFNVSAVTILGGAGASHLLNLASVFTLWNPPQSGVLAEMVDTEVGQTSATTVVDAIGWYFSSGAQALAGTFTTKAAANTNYFAARIGDIPNGQVIPYTSYAHSGTPVRVDIIGSFGAITDVGLTTPNKVYDGRLVIPPGVAASIAGSTADFANIDLGCRWVEWPFA